MFLSTIAGQLDKKGRVSVPAGFRLALAGGSFAGVVAYPSFIRPCIEACGMERMEKLSQSIDALDPYGEERDAFATSILGAASALAFDSEGRVMLPKPLLEAAGIQDQLVFVGKGSMFEIWEPGAYQQHAAKARQIALEQRGKLQLQSGVNP